MAPFSAAAKHFFPPEPPVHYWDSPRLWKERVVSTGTKGQTLKLTTHISLIPKRGAFNPRPH